MGGQFCLPYLHYHKLADPFLPEVRPPVRCKSRLSTASKSPVMEPHWTLRDGETTVSHVILLGHGGYGEVHKVPL